MAQNSFILNSKGVQHLPHFWQPTIDFNPNIIRSVLDDIHGYINGNKQSLDWNYSTKYDGKVSLAIVQSNGKYGVKYKGVKSPVAFNEIGIKNNYGDKPYYSSLLALYSHSNNIIRKLELDHIKDNFILQLEYMRSDIEDSVAVEKTYIPNIINYKSDNYAVISIVPISLTIGNSFKLVSFDENRYATNFKHIEILPNRFNENISGVHPDYIELFNDYYDRIASIKFTKEEIKYIQYNADAIKKSFNYLVRAYSRSILESDFRVLTIRHKYFNLLFNINILIIEMTKHAYPCQEGIVVSTQYTDNEVIAFKMVDPQFSYNNFNKNDN